MSIPIFEILVFLDHSKGKHKKKKAVKLKTNGESPLLGILVYRFLTIWELLLYSPGGSLGAHFLKVILK